MINTTVTLSEIEQRICKHIAKTRFENNRQKHVQNAKIGKQNNEFTDLEGFGGEMAFCKIFNLFPDFSIQPRSSQKKEDEKADANLSGKIIDVKTTKYPNGKLLAVPWKNEKTIIDGFALMVGEFPTYTFKGFMKTEELMKKERLGSLGYGKTYIAEQKELVGEIIWR